jgi:phenylpropionate dioxygenase-like ring-hydroxylating dioxygenase large terminal subunit
MLVNLWYVVQESRNVTNRPVHVRLLGQDLVLFRDADSGVVWWSDICVHRGASPGCRDRTNLPAGARQAS